MNDATIQPGRSTWPRLIRKLLVAGALLWWFFGVHGTPFLRIGGPYRLETGFQAGYLGLSGTAYFPANEYEKFPLIVLMPLKNSVAFDVWHGIVAIKRFAFD